MGDWDFAHCLPYFNRMENCLAAAPDDPFRGHDGPLALERGPAINPLFRGVLTAAEQAGYPRTDDVTVTGKKVSRSSTATSATAGGSRPPAPTCIP